MWGWIILGLAVLVVIVIIFIKKKSNDNYIDLDSRLTGVKSFWDKCCAKIKNGFGV